MRYFKYNYKKMIMPTLFLIILGFSIYTMPILLIDPNRTYQNPNLEALSIYLLIIAIFVPIYEGRVLKNKRGADLYYSLPMSKKKLNLDIYLKGLMQIVLAYTTIFLLTLLINISKNLNLVMIYYLPLYFILLIGVIVYYSFNTFIFSKANNVIDGIILILLYILLLFMIESLVQKFFYLAELGYYDFENSFLPYQILFSFNKYLNIELTILQSNNNYMIDNIVPINVWIASFIWILISFSLTSLHLLYTKHVHPENIEQKSSSWFAYKTLIPVLAFLITFLTDLNFHYIFDMLLLIIILVAIYISYVIYERTFKISLKNLLLTCSIVCITIIINTMT